MTLKDDVESSGGTPGLLSRCKKISKGKLAAWAAGICLGVALIVGLSVGLAVSLSHKDDDNNTLTPHESWQTPPVASLPFTVVGISPPPQPRPPAPSPPKPSAPRPPSPPAPRPPRPPHPPAPRPPKPPRPPPPAIPSPRFPPPEPPSWPPPAPAPQMQPSLADYGMLPAPLEILQDGVYASPPGDFLGMPPAEPPIVSGEPLDPQLPALADSPALPPPPSPPPPEPPSPPPPSPPPPSPPTPRLPWPSATQPPSPAGRPTLPWASAATAPPTPRVPWPSSTGPPGHIPRVPWPSSGGSPAPTVPRVPWPSSGGSPAPTVPRVPWPSSGGSPAPTVPRVPWPSSGGSPAPTVPRVPWPSSGGSPAPSVPRAPWPTGQATPPTSRVPWPTGQVAPPTPRTAPWQPDRPANPGPRPVALPPPRQGAPLTTPQQPPAAPPLDALPTAGWRLLWYDEFNGNGLNTSKWGFDLGRGDSGWGNDELQSYTSDLANVRVQGGWLLITARKAPDGSFTSARITTKASVAFAPGVMGPGGAFGAIRVEGRLRLPAPGQGLWPAFWMLPRDFKYGIWPASGEIDICESTNTMMEASHCIHYGGTGPGWQHVCRPVRQASAAPYSDGFHIYAVDWSADVMTFSIDGRPTYTVRSKAAQGAAGPGWFSLGPGAGPWAPFDQPFYLILNLAVGGRLPGAPSPATQLPATLAVDYVRVYGR